MNENYKNIRQAVREEIWHNAKLIESLKHFIENDAAFYPGYGNLGDGLIALGTLDLFEDLGWSPKCIEGRSKETFSGYNYIVMGGGGGWVKGLWETYLEQTLTFLQNGGQLLILPTSFFGFGSEFVPYADQVTIFVGSSKATKSFSGKGCRKIGFLSVPTWLFIQMRSIFPIWKLKASIRFSRFSGWMKKAAGKRLPEHPLICRSCLMMFNGQALSNV